MTGSKKYISIKVCSFTSIVFSFAMEFKMVCGFLCFNQKVIDNLALNQAPYGTKHSVDYTFMHPNLSNVLICIEFTYIGSVSKSNQCSTRLLMSI